MDRDVIERKLESLRRCVARVKDKRPASLDWAIVYALAEVAVVDFENFGRQVAARLLGRETTR